VHPANSAVALSPMPKLSTRRRSSNEFTANPPLAGNEEIQHARRSLSLPYTKREALLKLGATLEGIPD
jgi:hypothetical protein